MIKKSLILILCLAAGAHAVPIGRPVAAENQWLVGGVFAYDRLDMEDRSGRFTGTVESNFWTGEAVYGFTQGGEFYLRLGLSDDQLDAGAFQPAYSSKMNWGLGLRGTLYDSWQNWRLIGDVQWFARPARDWQNADLDFSEWQAAVAMEYRVSNQLFPYAGLFYQDLEIKSNNPAVHPSLVLKRNFGAYTGIGYEPAPNWSLFAEGRFSSGGGFAAGAHRRF